jgi:Arc/MetJ-type ribon-helix-helix transcriptional regulator
VRATIAHAPVRVDAASHLITIGLVARTQTIVQLSDKLLAELDSRRAREGRSRSELIRDAIEAYLAADREAAIDRAIIEGYARIPPADEFGADWAARSTIAAEPWGRLGDHGDETLDP